MGQGAEAEGGTEDSGLESEEDGAEGAGAEVVVVRGGLEEKAEREEYSRRGRQA